MTWQKSRDMDRFNMMMLKIFIFVEEQVILMGVKSTSRGH